MIVIPQLIEITDLSDDRLSCFSKLSEPQLFHLYEPQEGAFVAESPYVIGLALDAGYQPVSMLVDRDQLCEKTLQVIDRCSDISVYTAESSLLSQITGFKLTRGALCLMRRKKLSSAEQICSGARRIAVLEDVVNPTNVGAIIRSAAALNIDAVLLSPACSDPLYRRAARVSMGTVFLLPWTYLSADVPYVQQVHQLGFRTAAMALDDNSVSISDPRLAAEDKLALFLGTEGTGLSQQTIDACDYTVKIPMSHGVDSLNVAAASAVAFWQLANDTKG